MAKVSDTEAERFSRLATSRVNQALKFIALVGKTTGSNYKSTADQRNKIKATLNKAVEEAMQALNGEASSKPSFSV